MKKLTMKDVRTILETHQEALARIASATATDFDQCGSHMQATRELVTDISARLDRLEAQMRQLVDSKLDVQTEVVVAHV